MAHDIQRTAGGKRSFAFGAFGIAVLFILGCGSQLPDQDDAQWEAIRSGTQTLLDTPSQDLIDRMASDPQGAAAVTGIWLQTTDLSDPKWATFDQLKSLPGLRLIRCYQTTNTDAFANVLVGLPQVTTLAFHETDFSDAGLKNLAKMSQLEDLLVEFKRGGVTDAGLANLAPLKKLKKLKIMTDDPLTGSQLKAALPSCTITVERYSSGPTTTAPN